MPILSSEHHVSRIAILLSFVVWHQSPVVSHQLSFRSHALSFGVSSPVVWHHAFNFGTRGSSPLGTKFLVLWYHTSQLWYQGLHNIPWVRFVTVGARCFVLASCANRHKAILDSEF
eukprot:COSAG02_NODE_24862_length_675_cov_1.774306_1_plen_116_part_00